MAYRASELTRERLILAAEGLFATRGIRSVSAREIVKAANMRYNCSVTYHFESMDGLIRSIVRYRVIQLEKIRSGMIRSDGIDRASDVTFWMECLLLPHLQVRSEDGFHAYASLLCQYLPLHYPKGFPWRRQDPDDFMPAFDEILFALRTCISYLPSDIFDRRLTNASLLFLNVLVGLSRDDSLESLGREHPLIRDAIRQSVAVLLASWDPSNAPAHST